METFGPLMRRTGEAEEEGAAARRGRSASSSSPAETNDVIALKQRHRQHAPGTRALPEPMTTWTTDESWSWWGSKEEQSRHSSSLSA